MFSVRVACLLLSSSTPQNVSDVNEPLTLSAATEIALEYANDMIQAREDVVLVDADYATALSAILPTLDMSMQGGHFYSVEQILEQRSRAGSDGAITIGEFTDITLPSFDNANFALGLVGRQLIFDGGRWWKAIGQAKDNRAARKADLQAVTNLVKARVARTFFGLERARQAIVTFKAQVDVDQAQVDRAEALLRAGRGAPADVATAKRNLASDQILLVDAMTLEGQARNTFNLTLGRRANIPVELTMPEEVRSSTAAVRFVPELDQLQGLMRRHRPELASLRAQVSGAQKAVSIARADYWPTMAFEARYNRSSRRPDRVVANPLDNFTATINLVVNWNLFRGFATNADVERAQANLRKLQATYDEQERQLFVEVSDSLLRYRNQVRNAGFAVQQVEAAEEAVRLARGLYEAGRGNALELRDAELGLTRARIATVNARLDAAIAYSDLIAAVGSDEWAAAGLAPAEDAPATP